MSDYVVNTLALIGGCFLLLFIPLIIGGVWSDLQYKKQRRKELDEKINLFFCGKNGEQSLFDLSLTTKNRLRYLDDRIDMLYGALEELRDEDKVIPNVKDKLDMSEAAFSEAEAHIQTVEKKLEIAMKALDHYSKSVYNAEFVPSEYWSKVAIQSLTEIEGIK